MPSLGEPARQCTALHLAARPVFVDQAWETHYKFEPKANSRPSQSLTTNSRPPHGMSPSSRAISTPLPAYSA
jgi:hypothetical protein